MKDKISIKLHKIPNFSVFFRVTNMMPYLAGILRIRAFQWCMSCPMTAQHEFFLPELRREPLLDQSNQKRKKGKSSDWSKRACYCLLFVSGPKNFFMICVRYWIDVAERDWTQSQERTTVLGLALVSQISQSQKVFF